MSALTRRREKDRHQESWHIYFGDVRAGWIGERAGVPHDEVDQWGLELRVLSPVTSRSECGRHRHDLHPRRGRTSTLRATPDGPYRGFISHFGCEHIELRGQAHEASGNVVHDEGAVL
jgi:hypothetical protein